MTDTTYLQFAPVCQSNLPVPVRMAKFILALASSVALASCSLAETDEELLPPPPFSEEDEQAFLEAKADFRDVVQKLGRVGRYDPLEAVPGADSTEPLGIIGQGRLSEEALELAHSYVEERRSSALLVWADGHLEVERYFGGFDRNTPIVSKALAKPLTTMVIGRAIQLGHIDSVDQPVADFIREWQGVAKKSEITIRHLLEMRSGLLPQDFSSDAPPVLERALLHPRHDSVLVHEYPVTDAPGERFEYSNANSELLALVIERATGRRYAEFLGNELLLPIEAEGGEIWVDRPGGLAHSGCCIMLPAFSWLRLGVLLLNDGVWEGETMLPASFVRDMKTGTQQNPHFGMGLWVAGPYKERRGYLNPSNTLGAVLHSEPYLDRDIALFDGNGNQVMYLIPSTRMVILRTGERPTGELEWDNSYLPNLLIADFIKNTGRAMPEAQGQ